jgi:hypothetical protein
MEEKVKKIKINKPTGSPHPRYFYMSKNADKIMWRNVNNKEKDKGEIPLIDLLEFVDGKKIYFFTKKVATLKFSKESEKRKKMKFKTNVSVSLAKKEV